MRVREDENVPKYVERIKASISTIRASGREIKEETVVTKILRTLLPIYAIRVSTIQEKRCDSNSKLDLDALVGRLIAFELDNFDNYVPASKNIESTFEAKLSLKEKWKKIKDNQSESEEETKENSDSDLKVVKAHLQRRIPRIEESTKVKFL